MTCSFGGVHLIEVLLNEVIVYASFFLTIMKISVEHLEYFHNSCTHCKRWKGLMHSWSNHTDRIVSERDLRELAHENMRMFSYLPFFLGRNKIYICKHCLWRGFSCMTGAVIKIFIYVIGWTLFTSLDVFTLCPLSVAQKQTSKYMVGRLV